MTLKVILLGLLVSGIAAAQKVPKGTYNASQYAEAKAEAAKEGKNIAVIYTEIDSSCPKCRFGNETAFKEMRSDYVLVLEDKGSKSETGALPEDIKQKTYVTYKEKGNVIPIITVFAPQTDAVLSGACYKQISADERKWLKNVEQEIASKPAEETPEGRPDSNTEEANRSSATQCDPDGIREWTDTLGRTMKASFVHADDMTATFKLANGKQVDLPLTKLSKESRDAIEECR
ncbi:SHD1 domain-containing protein [Haloferula chungangensis]|uniref:SHD1 domain-containing protein n=1 Tax=Haloferula chungangensis TaxID=1048331 RepID=A0ABW2L6H6_9BACT